MNAKQLMKLIDRLDINEDNFMLWEELYDQPFYIFFPFFMRLLKGDISIYDFVPRTAIYTTAQNHSNIDDSSNTSMVDRILDKLNGLPTFQTVTLYNAYDTEKDQINAISKYNILNNHTKHIQPELADYIFTFPSRNTISLDFDLLTLSHQEYTTARREGISILEMKKRKQLYSHNIITRGI